MAELHESPGPQLPLSARTILSSRIINSKETTIENDINLTVADDYILA